MLIVSPALPKQTVPNAEDQNSIDFYRFVALSEANAREYGAARRSGKGVCDRDETPMRASAEFGQGFERGCFAGMVA
jgi:hypothetical protein